MRSGIFFLCCTLQSLNCWAQSDNTVLLDSVEVYGLPDERYLAGSELQSIDSALLHQNDARHLGDVLAVQLPAYFRNYGNGMISGISLRGTSPQHTAVLWNGMNINSFSLGQADFSILPATAFDDVRVHAGGGSARFGSGAFGGTVLLNSGTPTALPLLTVSQDVGSFGRYFTAARVAVARHRWSAATKVFHQQCENDFPIPATGERQPHAAFRQWGVLQDIGYQWSDATSLSLHYWYNDTDRQVQPAIGQQISNDEQQDENHRLSMQYKVGSRLGLFSANSGFVQDVIVFNGGRTTIQRWIAGARHEWEMKKIAHVQVGAEWNHIVGKIPEYPDGRAEEDRFDFTASLSRTMRRLAVALNLRQPVVTGFTAPFLPYLGADYSVLQRHRQSLKLRANISKNYRVPTLNDRYWQNAGSTTLLPETSYAAEAGWQWQGQRLTLSNTWFTQEIDDWIQWVPQENGNYRPRNVKHVRAQGVEARLTAQLKWSSVTIVPLVTYQFTRSITTEAPPAEAYAVGKQLIYTPRHTATATVRAGWRQYTVAVLSQYSSKRFTDFSNADLYALDPYALVDVTAGRSFTRERHRFELFASVRNVFDTAYEQYSGRAMPGRNYNIKLFYQLNTNTK